MNCAREIIFAVGAAVIVPPFASGCQQPQTFSEPEKADIRDSWQPGNSQAVAHPKSMLVKEGPAPLAYLAQQSGVFHVSDVASGKWLATGSATQGTMIRIELDQGIFIGRRQLQAGPLPPGRRYGIVLDLDQSNAWRSGIEAPKPVPASQPAKQQ